MYTLLADIAQIFIPPTCWVCRRPLRHPGFCPSCRLPEVLLQGDETCPSCQAPYVGQDDLCALCTFGKEPFSTQRYLWAYSGNASLALRQMKYGQSMLLAKYFGRLLAAALSFLYEEDLQVDYILPMPSTRASLDAKGFLPCAVMAREIARSALLGRQTRYAHDIFWRTDALPQRALLSGKRRERLGLPHFGIHKAKLAGTRILLIEDVVTTGITAYAAALALRLADVQEIHLLSVCRAKRWQRTRSQSLERCAFSLF